MIKMQMQKTLSASITTLDCAAIKSLSLTHSLSVFVLTGFLHFEHVTEPQSGQINRRCFGRAKKPDEHCEESSESCTRAQFP
jgi:hypothetical protein